MALVAFQGLPFLDLVVLLLQADAEVAQAEDRQLKLDSLESREYSATGMGRILFAGCLLCLSIAAVCCSFIGCRKLPGTPGRARGASNPAVLEVFHATHSGCKCAWTEY